MSKTYPCRYDNCKDCVARCQHAGKDREFVYHGFKSCKIVKKPPRLDRSAWEPCDFCGKADFGEFGFEISKHYAKIVCALGAWRFPKNERFNFCPKCGRPLTDAAWDMLEKRLEGAK